MNKGTIKKFYFPLAFTFLVLLSIITFNCADDPSSLGLGFIPPGETTGVRTFDSYVDTLPIISTNIKKYINTSQSPYLMVGRSGSYDSKAILRFSALSSNYDSAVVNYAKINLKYKNYYFPYTAMDSLGQISFDVFTIQYKIDPFTITIDSVNSMTFGTTPIGSYTGTPTFDSADVSFNLDAATVKGWLDFAADTNSSIKNYGIVMIPNGGSRTIKGFNSAVTASSLRPEIEISVTKNGVTDTITSNLCQSTSLVNTSFLPNPEIFNIQSGVAFDQIMRFDLSRLASTVILNDVQIFLTLDSANSKLNNNSYKIIKPYVISDTAGLVLEPSSIESKIVNNQYMIRIINPFQRWVQGQTNYGILLAAKKDFENLDLYSFYDMTASDPNKRPRVIIKYTPRITP